MTQKLFQEFLSRSTSYQSQWGNDPQQAETIREFMLGVGETISGVFCVVVSSGIASGIGAGLFLDGCRRMFITLNSAWAEHEKAMISLKKWEESSKAIVNTN